MSLEDWEVVESAGATKLWTKGATAEGLSILVHKGRRSFTISAWYDSMVGIWPLEISLDELASLLARKQRKRKPK
jgi:hypothetical protein